MFGAAVAGAAIGATVMWALSQNDRQRKDPSAAGGNTPTEKSAMAKFGLPSDGNLRWRTEYVSSINYERRIPNWVLEYFEQEDEKNQNGKENKATEVTREKSSFQPDHSVPEFFRAENSDYWVGKWLSRGHLAPAQLHKTTQGALNETFLLSSNIVPQDMSLNACDWFRLEQLSKKMKKEFPRGLWVVTGPLFLSEKKKSGEELTIRGGEVCEMRYRLIGKNNVAVPTHMFKAILGESPTGQLGAAAFVMPNEPIPQERALTAYQVPLENVESAAGLQLFPSANRKKMYDMCRKHDCNGGYRLWAPFSPGYRKIGVLRAAAVATGGGKHQVEKEFGKMKAMAVARGEAVEATVEKEYDALMKQLNH